MAAYVMKNQRKKKKESSSLSGQVLLELEKSMYQGGSSQAEPVWNATRISMGWSGSGEWL
jgi:hypothetical protein